MKYKHLFFALIFLLVNFSLVTAKLPDITPDIVKTKFGEMMKAHASENQLNDTIIKRALNNYLDLLDGTKTYFIASDVEPWTNPSKELIDQILADYQKGNFSTFEKIVESMQKAIVRRHLLDEEVNKAQLPEHVKAEEFKDLPWVANEQELLERLIKLRALQVHTAKKLNEEQLQHSLQRIAKRQAKFEEEITTKDPKEREKFVLVNVLKAFAGALDSHTSYFTPEEAEQFMINVQQRLFGIGAQLRDDLNGFTIIKIVEGGPAARQGKLKVKDRIIAVNGEPIVGMDILDAVDLIRGAEGTAVDLKVIRELDTNGHVTEETLDVPMIRGAVIITEARYETAIEPFGEAVIAYLRLHSFYQDEKNSSAEDLKEAFNKISKEYKVSGIVLDLRYNSGGMLSQAVAVTDLFIKKGVVVSIKDDSNQVQRLRNIDNKVMWDGPLILLINRASASASEIVSQALQDYGRALIVGDDQSYGKGSFQTFTLNVASEHVNPQGEYKVTRGRYYTVSGASPQLVGVKSDIVIPGPLSESEIGERFAKYPLSADHIQPSFDDDLTDIPSYQRDKVKLMYKQDLQTKVDIYTPYLAILKTNSKIRLENNKSYQAFLKELKKKDSDLAGEEQENIGQNDLQLSETYNIMRDLILLLIEKKEKAA